MSTIYTYSVAGDTALGTCSADGLGYEVRTNPTPLASAALELVDADGDALNIHFAGAGLDAGDKTLLDGLVAAHAATPVPGNIVVLAAHIVNEYVHGNETVWVDVGGIVTRVEAFGVLSNMRARITAAVDCDGDGVDLQIVERKEGEADRAITTGWGKDATTGFEFYSMDSDQDASPGTWEYMLQMRLRTPGNNATLRSVSLTMLDVPG